MASPRAQLGAYKVSKPPSFGLVPSPPKKNGKVRVAAIRTRDARAALTSATCGRGQAVPPIDSPEQRKAQRDEAERINQLIRRRRPADEQPVDESNVDAGDATDVAPTRSGRKGPSGGSRLKADEIGVGEDEARRLP